MTPEEIVLNGARVYDLIDAEDRPDYLASLYYIEDEWTVGGITRIPDGTHPTDFLKLIKVGLSLEDAPDGILLILDTWGYPDHVLDKTQGMTREQAMKLMERVGPPSEHPERVTYSTVFFYTRFKDQVSTSGPRGKPYRITPNVEGTLHDAMAALWP